MTEYNSWIEAYYQFITCLVIVVLFIFQPVLKPLDQLHSLSSLECLELTSG